MTKVINSPCAASRARVDCVPYSSQSGFIDKPCCSQSTPARVRVREGLSPIRDHEAYFRAWRVAKFGGDFDPIRVAVDEAAMAFSSGKSEKGKASDRRVWLKIANRVGLSGFLDAFEQKASEIRDLSVSGIPPLRSRSCSTVASRREVRHERPHDSWKGGGCARPHC